MSAAQTAPTNRRLYISRRSHVSAFSPYMGTTAANLGWLSGMCLLVQGPAMLVWIVAIFLGATTHTRLLVALGVVVLLASSVVLLLCPVFRRRARSARMAFLHAAEKA